MELAWWIWMILGIALLIAEVITPTSFYLMFFGLGALLVGVLAAVGLADSGALQWFLFAAFSVGCIVFLRSRFAFMRGKTSDMDADNVVGQEAILMEELNPNCEGKAEMRGSVWKARNVGVKVLNKGQRCKVEALERLTLIVGKDH